MKAALFPGQGIDPRAVLAGLPEDHPRVEQASEILGFDLRREVVRHGPGSLRTALAQPAILVAGVVAYETAVADGAGFDHMLGHSLGEYTALVASGSLSFRDGVRVVGVRGAAMAEAARANPGGMAAVIGLDVAAIEAVAAASGTSVANENSPNEIVLAGSDDALERAATLVSERGGRCVRLRVEGPFHTEAMSSAVEPLREALDRALVRSPKIPVIANVSGAPYRAPGEVRALLLAQLTGRIRFRACVEWLITRGVQGFVDLGPGRVAEKLARATISRGSPEPTKVPVAADA